MIEDPAPAHARPATGWRRRRAELLSLPVTLPRGLRHRLLGEIALVTLGALLLAALMDPDAVRGLTTTAPGDLGDPLYFAWQLAWVRHALGSDPAGLWTTNAFLQAPGNLAFTDTVLGYAPLSLLVPDGQAGALALLNLAVLTSTALATIGGYALARALGAPLMGSVVAAAGFGYAPWRLEQVIHINVISTGGIALALALLARGNGWSLRAGWQPERMDARWVAAGWLVACWQLTFGFATGIWFVYSLAVPMLAWSVGWVVSGRRRAGLGRSLVMAHGLGGLAFGATGGLLLRPYLRVIAEHPEAVRGENWLPLFSPPWRGLLTAPTTSVFWGDRQLGWRAGLSWPPEMVLSPGLVLIGLAALGVFFSIWPWRRRLGLLAATAAVTVLAMGTAFPGAGTWTYLPLFHHVPGWSALRTPGRLMIWVTLGLVLLAAGAVSRFFAELVDLTPGSRPTSSRVALVAAIVLGLVPTVTVLYEGRGDTPHWNVSTSPVRLSRLPAPVLLLPSNQVADYHLMLWGTEGWPVLANGGSGFEPTFQTRLRAEAETFPDAESVARLRARGVLTVVVIRSRTDRNTGWAGAADAPVDGLPLRRTDYGDAVVFDLR